MICVNHTLIKGTSKWSQNLLQQNPLTNKSKRSKDLLLQGNPLMNKITNQRVCHDRMTALLSQGCWKQEAQSLWTRKRVKGSVQPGITSKVKEKGRKISSYSKPLLEIKSQTSWYAMATWQPSWARDGNGRRLRAWFDNANKKGKGEELK